MQIKTFLTNLVLIFWQFTVFGATFIRHKLGNNLGLWKKYENLKIGWGLMLSV